MTAPESLPPELWAPVPDEPGYEVSNRGQVRSVDRVIMRRNGQPQRIAGQALRLMVRYDGRPTVSVRNRKRFVHHLVLEAFVGPRPDGMECCHEDDNPANNWLGNLRWDTHSANTIDRKKNKGLHQLRRVQCPLGHPLAKPNLVPSSLPHRSCLACNRARCRVNWWRRKRGVELDLRQQADAYYSEIMVRSAA